jgi:hypothetical protein
MHYLLAGHAHATEMCVTAVHCRGALWVEGKTLKRNWMELIEYTLSPSEEDMYSLMAVVIHALVSA